VDYYTQLKHKNFSIEAATTHREQGTWIMQTAGILTAPLLEQDPDYPVMK
jgi:hypothetical protein